MKWVVDASVAAKWLAPEPDSRLAEALLDEVVEAEAMNLTPSERGDLADTFWLLARGTRCRVGSRDRTPHPADRFRRGRVHSLGGRDDGNARQVRLMQIIVDPAALGELE